MTQGATGNKKWNKNRKQSLKILGYKSRVTTKEACSQREMFVGIASKLTRDLTALQKYSAKFRGISNQGANKISVNFTLCSQSDQVCSEIPNPITFNKVNDSKYVDFGERWRELCCGKPLPNTDLKRAKI